MSKSNLYVRVNYDTICHRTMGLRSDVPRYWVVDLESLRQWWLPDGK